MFFFSIHQNQADIGDHSKYSKGWSVKMFNSIYTLGESCLDHLNSPIVWCYGIRKQENFVYSDFIVIDVDDDSKLSLEGAMELYSRHIHLIGTTKSHNILKGNRVSERYRIFILVERRIVSAKEYRFLCLREAARCGGDLLAANPSQQFMPLQRIVSYAEVGRKLSYPEDLEKRHPWKTGFKPEDKSRYSLKKEIPPYIQRWLDGDVGYGERNITSFKAACGLKKRNFSEDEVIEIILSSSLPLKRTDKIDREIRDTVKSAYKRK